MFFVESYPVAIVMCVVTMLCWGSWANTQKLASKEWRFQLFYWDYCIGVLVLTLLFALTLGSMGSSGRGFLEDLSQASARSLGYAFLGGVVFNVANILLVAAIDIAGMAVAFPVGIGLALVIGVVTNYWNKPGRESADSVRRRCLVAAAIVVDALAYRRLPSAGQDHDTQRDRPVDRVRRLDGFLLSAGRSSMQKLEDNQRRYPIPDCSLPTRPWCSLVWGSSSPVSSSTWRS